MRLGLGLNLIVTQESEHGLRPVLLRVPRPFLFQQRVWFARLINTVSRILRFSTTSIRIHNTHVYMGGAIVWLVKFLTNSRRIFKICQIAKINPLLIIPAIQQHNDF